MGRLNGIWVKYFLTIHYFYTNYTILEYIREMLSLTRKITTELRVFLDLPAVSDVWFDFPFWYLSIFFPE